MKNTVLVVDDEKNIRFTVSESLSSLGLEVTTAINGEEALALSEKNDYAVMLLDLRLPGIDGIEVLRRIRQKRPDIRVIVITAYGTVESAVEAMKMGAVDFIQKPFSPAEIRKQVKMVFDRETIDEKNARDYDTIVELGKRCMSDRHLDAASEHIRRAIGLDPSRPEAFNLMGAVHEIMGDRLEAQKNYRTALSIDATYEPARKNLYRLTELKPEGAIVIDKKDIPKK